MKSSKRKVVRATPPKSIKKIPYEQAAGAISRKLEEIKQENKQSAAVNNNLSLFRYKV